jgi:hypothetical protein
LKFSNELSIYSFGNPLTLPIHLNISLASSYLYYATKNLGLSGIKNKRIVPEILSTRFGIYSSFHLSLIAQKNMHIKI